MNLQQIQASIVGYMLGMDIDPGEMNVWINDAIGDLAVISKVKKTVAISLVTGTNTYVLPADFLGLASIEQPLIVTGNPLDLESYGFPYAFSLWGTNLIVKPTPQRDSAQTMYYYGIPKVLQFGTDIPDIPAAHHKAIVFYAVSQAKAKYSQMLDAEIFEGLYQKAKRDISMFIAMQEGPQFMRGESRWC